MTEIPFEELLVNCIDALDNWHKCGSGWDKYLTARAAVVDRYEEDRLDDIHEGFAKKQAELYEKHIAGLEQELVALQQKNCDMHRRAQQAESVAEKKHRGDAKEIRDYRRSYSEANVFIKEHFDPKEGTWNGDHPLSYSWHTLSIVASVMQQLAALQEKYKESQSELAHSESDREETDRLLDLCLEERKKLKQRYDRLWEWSGHKDGCVFFRDQYKMQCDCGLREALRG